MIFSNPYFVILLILMAVSLIHANSVDGQSMPDRNYSFTHTMIAVLINFLLVFGAVYWAHSQ